jgi:hypothetical protein
MLAMIVFYSQISQAAVRPRPRNPLLVALANTNDHNERTSDGGQNWMITSFDVEFEEKIGFGGF